MTLVTRESLQEMLDNENPKYAIAVIGRALVHLFERQTVDEKESNDVQISNSVGFTGADALSGSLTAKYYLKHKTLENWQVNRWKKKGKNGFSRLTKYHRQLNEIAEALELEKKAEKYCKASNGY